MSAEVHDELQPEMIEHRDTSLERADEAVYAAAAAFFLGKWSTAESISKDVEDAQRLYDEAVESNADARVIEQRLKRLRYFQDLKALTGEVHGNFVGNDNE
jgi:hypothetical protein